MTFLMQEKIRHIGDWFFQNRNIINYIQWIVIVCYVTLLILPTVLPLPNDSDHIYNNLVRFSQFLFWGVWWPFVILSIVLFGRIWCGVFCPEGALTEWASKHGRNRLAIPAWIKWPVWPFLAFALTTIYGQMISVYEYPKPALLILGGSTIAAMIVGYLWVKEYRVWCRYLCPVNGVFRILARISPVHYITDRRAWSENPRTSKPVTCAPLINIKNLDSSGGCHMCGRCSGHRNAIKLQARLPSDEIVRGVGELSVWEIRLLVFGIFGIALAAFQWSASPWYVLLKQMIAEWAVSHEQWWAFKESDYWWLLTSYPMQNDVFLLIDGVSLLIYIALITTAFGGGIWLLLTLAGSIGNGKKFRNSLIEAMTPIAAATLFLGLLQLLLGQLRGERIMLPGTDIFEATVLSASMIWSIYLAWRIMQRMNHHVSQNIAAISLFTLAASMPVAGISLVLFYW